MENIKKGDTIKLSGSEPNQDGEWTVGNVQPMQEISLKKINKTLDEKGEFLLKKGDVIVDDRRDVCFEEEPQPEPWQVWRHKIHGTLIAVFSYIDTRVYFSEGGKATSEQWEEFDYFLENYTFVAPEGKLGKNGVEVVE